PPSVAVPIPSVRVVEGETADLTCLVNSNPPATIRWTRPILPVNLVIGHDTFRTKIGVTVTWNREFHLRIEDALIEDGGAYTCNILGLTPKEAKLTVVVPVPQPPTLRGAEVPGKAGQQLELSCTSSGGHPPPQLTWYNGTEAFTEQHVNKNEREGEVELNLIIRRLTKWDNGMNLTCRASQSFPEITSAQEAWTVLQVHYPPSVSVPIPSVRVLEGDTADLTCLVDSNPPATISWTRPGRPTLVNGNTRQRIFRIPRTSRQDAGDYQCTADNGVQPVAVGTVTLEVLYPPLINPSMDDKTTALQDDNDFSLNCLVEGNPKPKVTWRRKDTKLYWKNPLRFNRVRYDVEGTYQCVGISDGFPQQTKDVFVDVVGKPYMEGDSDTAMLSADSGETVRLGCTVAADPLPSRINWIWRNNYGLETDLDNADFEIVTARRNQEMTSSLTIQNVAVKDSGSYICKTTNMFGSAKRDMHLEVKDSTPNLVIITSITAGGVLVVTVAVIITVIAKKKGWICKPQLDAPRPMPPVPKYVYKTGTIDSGVEDLQELQEMYGTLKPRPPPRMEKKWESVGLSYSVNGVSYNAVPLPTAVLLGHTATLHCSFNDLSADDVVSWVRHPGRVIAYGRRVNPAYQRYQVVGDEKKGEFHLLIQDAHLEDGGAYTCNIFGDLTPKEAKLTVVDPPSVTVPIPSVRVVEGVTADLTCLVESNPAATIRWTRPDRPAVLNGNIGQKIFRIPSTSHQDAGVYQCTADNGVPPLAVGTVTLEVLYPPLINPSMDDKVTALQDDDDFSLNCLVEGNPKPKVTWRRKDTKLYWKNPLRFNRVRYDVEGTYQCVGTSDGFPQQTKDVFVDVLGKPYMEGEGDTAMLSADTGETVRLGCTVAADPLPSRINWIWRNYYGQETELDSNVVHIVTTRRNQEMTSSMTIQNVAVKDSGSYICETTNMFGSAKRDMHLEVKESAPNLVIITSITAGGVLVVTVAVILVVIAKKKAWICKSHLDDSFDLSAPRPMPPMPKYVYNTGTIDSGVEDLQELQEMYGTLKPRPPPRSEKKWESVGLSYSGLVHSTSLPPYSTEEE
ncbi:PREDICTED: hemicentin-2-like, partial [Branchiostoma belcheri]|uniref:Hemicentin-2-like n=1 Tax=Branchiostoma belcheri TaxID=7741 RepID=A0A6P4ZWD6_BRABE